MMWSKQKRKVNLAAQTLSASVADAIEFCRVTLKLRQFIGSEPTVRFLRLIDNLFDVLNSRNPVAKGYKAPMRPTNWTLEFHYQQNYNTGGHFLLQH